ncbi:MAG: hypothetical protein AAB380_01585 [Verrucomicrobiota bacterium]
MNTLTDSCLRKKHFNCAAVEIKGTAEFSPFPDKCCVRGAGFFGLMRFDFFSANSGEQHHERGEQDFQTFFLHPVSTGQTLLKARPKRRDQVVQRNAQPFGHNER